MVFKINVKFFFADFRKMLFKNIVYGYKGALIDKQHIKKNRIYFDIVFKISKFDISHLHE